MDNLQKILSVSAVALTICTALLYFSGWAMRYAYYTGYFGIPLAMIDYEFNEVLLNGRGSLFITLMLLAFIALYNRIALNLKQQYSSFFVRVLPTYRVPT